MIRPNQPDRALLLCHASGVWNKAFSERGIECVNVDRENETLRRAL